MYMIIKRKNTHIFHVWMIALFLLLCGGDIGAKPGGDFYLRASFYQDWMGLKNESNDLYHRLSSRLKLTCFNSPGNGWTVFMDARNRHTLGEYGKNQFILYNARLLYNSSKSNIFFSLGQMTLYDTAGIGQLTGAVAGYKLTKQLSLGGYGGLEPDIYNTKWDTKYMKYGVFVRYTGSGAKQLSVSFNRLLYDGEMERQFVYSSILFPFKNLFTLYGNAEHELGDNINSEDRLSRLFLNARVNVARYADVSGNYSSGRGLDYHRFILEQSQDPTLMNSQMERFYYNETYGVRLRYKPTRSIRLWAARRRSTLQDKEIVNNTTRFGLSVSNILKSGISLYGNFNLNRGDASESDSYYVSVSRDFGKLFWSLSYANYYNSIRFSGSGAPEAIHLPERRTLSTNVFLSLSRALAISLDYAFLLQEENNEHQCFIRIIYRKR